MSKYEALPAEVVQTDNRLEQSATKASEALAKHRWHWTLDESNPDRVSIRAYAHAVARGYSVIHGQVNGYAEWIKGDPARGISESIERAKMGTEKEAVTEAVAEARGLSFQRVRQSRPDEVKRVREMAREAAERKGTSVEEEAPRIAEFMVKSEKAETRNREQRKAAHTMRFIEIEGHVGAIMQRLRKILDAAQDVEFTDEERELVTASLGKMRALLSLVDLRITGKTNIDWDAAFAKLEN